MVTRKNRDGHVDWTKLLYSIPAKDYVIQNITYEDKIKLAADNGAESIAFCCLSTGVFRFPQQRAAQIATGVVKEYLEKDERIKKVIFNVFKDEDLRIYREILENGKE